MSQCSLSIVLRILMLVFSSSGTVGFFLFITFVFNATFVLFLLLLNVKD